MAIKNYKIYASFKNDRGISSGVFLGEAEIDNNKLSGNRDAFLKGFVQSHFGGEIAGKGDIINVSISEIN